MCPQLLYWNKTDELTITDESATAGKVSTLCSLTRDGSDQQGAVNLSIILYPILSEKKLVNLFNNPFKIKVTAAEVQIKLVVRWVKKLLRTSEVSLFLCRMFTFLPW